MLIFRKSAPGNPSVLAAEVSNGAHPTAFGRTRGTTANVLVEGNEIAASDVAVHVNYTTTQGGVALRNNTAPRGVPENFNPYA